MAKVVDSPPPKLPEANTNGTHMALVSSVRSIMSSGQESKEDLKAAIRSHISGEDPETTNQTLINLMTDAVGKKYATADLLGAIQHVAKDLSVEPCEQLVAILMRRYAQLGLKEDFNTLYEKARKLGVLTKGSIGLAMRLCSVSSDLKLAFDLMPDFGPLLNEAGATPSGGAVRLMTILSQQALKQMAVPELISCLDKNNCLISWTLEVILIQCVNVDELDFAQQLVKMAKDKHIQLKEASYSALIRSADCPEEVLRLFREASELKLVSRCLLRGLARATVKHSSEALVTLMLQYFELDPVVDVAVSTISNAKMCGATDADIIQMYTNNFNRVDLLADAHGWHFLVDIALSNNQMDIVQTLLDRSSDGAKKGSVLRRLVNSGHSKEALSLLQACSASSSSSMYNALLEASVAKDDDTFEKVFAEATQNDVADVISYNALIKRYIHQGNIPRAQAAIKTMCKVGGAMAPNSLTFHEVMDATIRAGREGALELMEDMKACGLEPNRVTCSILLKSVQKDTKHSHLVSALSYIDPFDFDEILLSSALEACIRAGQKDHLRKQMKRFQSRFQSSSEPLNITGVQTFGSLVRACGFLGDVQGIWKYWEEMRAKDIVPSTITIGCMVEALSSCGHPHVALQLIRQLQADEQIRPLLNSVMYGSIVKGFARQRFPFDRIWALHDEMVKDNLQFTLVTFNAFIDSCTRSSRVDLIPDLLSRMERANIKPNVVTYCILLKGHCYGGRIDQAFELMEKMKRIPKCAPDEIAYNIILDGCAIKGLFDTGVAMVEEMEERRLTISSYTLTAITKLCSKCKKLDKAFELCYAYAEKYNIAFTLHVYNSLIYACVADGQWKRALEVLESMVQGRVVPDRRSYAGLLKAFIANGQAQEAASLVRTGFGLPGGVQELSRFNAWSVKPHNGLSAQLVIEVIKGIAVDCGDRQLAVELFTHLRAGSCVTFDSRQLTSLSQVLG
eukprot:CAMPEP_0197913222 /NCGR_PEP_ID=MMETSP1439-20131203/76237_1 /TAXON_ID=66791 /ORGANISM="Gonyaulax spinifera, Strain CCMP409" /LENGTH=964 /DNA_ID=CAMNT_0043535063 /DNA_START=229 /DNA_END=3126 /DNA_ORIENTATION=+